MQFHKGVGPRCPQIYFHVTAVVTNATKFGMVTMTRQNFRGQPHPYPMAGTPEPIVFKRIPFQQKKLE